MGSRGSWTVALLLGCSVGLGNTWTGEGQDPLPEPCEDQVEVCAELDIGQLGRLFRCDAGHWVEDPDRLDALCKARNFDFGYDCEQYGDEAIDPTCAHGPGTPCDAAPEMTCQDDSIVQCLGNRLAAEHCDSVCQRREGCAGTYDWGYCEHYPSSNDCVCYYLEPAVLTGRESV